MSTGFPSGWYRDPTGQGDARYWNGVSWTESVNRGGVVLNVGIDPSQAQVPPAPGTQVSIPPPPSTVQQESNSSSRSLLGVMIGVGVVFLIGILMYAIISNNSDGDDTPSPGSTPTEPAPEEPAPEAPVENG
jgi:hypothetical protein